MREKIKITKKKYSKPKIKSQKLKMSYFLSNIKKLDDFSIIGVTYASSHDGGGGVNQDAGYYGDNYGDSGSGDGSGGGGGECC